VFEQSFGLKKAVHGQYLIKITICMGILGLNNIVNGQSLNLLNKISSIHINNFAAL